MSGGGEGTIQERLRRVLASGMATEELRALLDEVHGCDLEGVVGEASRAYAAEPSPGTRHHLVVLLGSAPDALVERFEAETLDDADLELLAAGGAAFGEEGRFALALRWFERLLARDPTHLRGRTLRVWTRWLLTVDPEWEAEMRALAAEHPEDATIAELLGEMGG